jgi:hypothetical protein
VCLPLEATAETIDLLVDSNQWSHHSGVSMCTVAIFYVLSFGAQLQYQPLDFPRI